MKSYAVLFVPEFRLQASLRHSPHLRGQPVALLERHGAKLRVAELNDEAQAHRVERSMPPTQATARCTHLHLLNGNPGHERSAQDILLQFGETLSPFLESTQPGVVTVELPPERAWQESDFVEKIIAPLHELRLATRLGLAANPELALLAARCGSPVKVVRDAAAFLAPLPVAMLQPAEELLSTLASWGIRTLGDLTQLPVAQLGERLGPAAAQLWQMAQGGHPRPLHLIKPREFFSEQADLENRIEMLEPLLFLLRKFLEYLAARLAGVYLVAGKLRLVLRYENGGDYRKVFTIPQPTREVDVLFRLLHTHLENLTAESPIVGLELAAQPVRPYAHQPGLLEKGMRDPHQFAETLARLQALLGTDRVGTPVPKSSHHPDAFGLRPYDPAPTLPAMEDDLFIGVPCLKFRPAISADILLENEQPAFIYSTRHSGPIQASCGPWLLEGNWWEEQAWSREEWDIATEEGLYRLVRAETGWFLDGIYA